MEVVALTFGTIGFIYGMAALSKVSDLRKELEGLKARLGSE